MKKVKLEPNFGSKEKCNKKSNKSQNLTLKLTPYNVQRSPANFSTKLKHHSLSSTRAYVLAWCFGDSESRIPLFKIPKVLYFLLENISKNTKKTIPIALRRMGTGDQAFVCRLWPGGRGAHTWSYGINPRCRWPAIFRHLLKIVLESVSLFR